MAHDDHRGIEAVDELLEQVQALDVEVVGGLVQQVDVVPRQQERGQADTSGLTAGECRHRQVEGSRRARCRRPPARRARRSRRSRGPATTRGRRSTRRRHPAAHRRVRAPRDRAPPGRPPRRCAGPGSCAPTRRHGARAPVAGSRCARWRVTASPSPRPAPARRQGCAAAWSSPRRWARRVRSRLRARRSGRSRRKACGRRDRRPPDSPAALRSWTLPHRRGYPRPPH